MVRISPYFTRQPSYTDKTGGNPNYAMASLPGTSNSRVPLNTDHERGETKDEITTNVESSKEYSEEDLVSLLVKTLSCSFYTNHLA